MPDAPPRQHPLVTLRLNYKDAYDAVAMVFYLFLVYGWGLWIYPLGRDYGHLANSGADLPVIARQLWGLEVRLFGGNPVGYHLVNLALLYACMLLIYRFVNISVKGAWWFGTLAACLFMANPIHSEAIHNLVGVADLVPCLAGLAALTVYASNAASPSPGKHMLAYIAAGFAAGAYTESAMIGPALLAYELLVVPKALRSMGRGLRIGVLALTVAIVAKSFRSFGLDDLGQMFGPLYLIFYPVGFLPKTVESFHERPWTAWLAVAAVLVVITLIYRKAQRPILLFALVGMVLLRLTPQPRDVDWTHMVGGGQLLLPNALFNLGVVVLVFRIMEHPRWRLPMISITTMLVVVLFLMQWRSLKTWRDVGSYVRDFQAQAEKATGAGPEVGVLPDFQCYRGAPVGLSESIRYDTPFSRALPNVPLLPVHPQQLRPDYVTVRSWSESGGEAVFPFVREAPLYTHFPNAKRIEMDTPISLRAVWEASMPEGMVTMTVGANGELRAVLSGASLPREILPAVIFPHEILPSAAGEEADGESEPNADHK